MDRRRFATLGILPGFGVLERLGTIIRPTSHREGRRHDGPTWESFVRPFLSDAQWLPEYAYDAGHLLMVPVHAAYSSRADPSWSADLEDHARRFYKALENGQTLPENKITRQQYLYLFTQQAVRQKRANSEDRINWDLIMRIADVQSSIWATEPAEQWARAPFANMRDRIEWKLTEADPERSYYIAVTDEERFNFALAADLCTILGEDASDEARESVATADKFIATRGEFTGEGGWLLQPGVLWEHPDYAYAGHDAPSEDMEPKPIEGLASDTSHSHRLPLLLQSLQAVDRSNERATMYDEAILGLAAQFLNVALVHPNGDFPNGYRTTNYFDGHNGLYRWEYESQGEVNGYLPYELSGTLMLGWWIFLGTEETYEIFDDMSTMFPLGPEVVELYTGPNTTRERHPLATLPNFFAEGFAELIIRLAVQIDPLS